MMSFINLSVQSLQETYARPNDYEASSSVSTTVTRNSIVVQALQQFPSDIVAQTRSKIQDELRIQREALVQNIVSGDTLKRAQNLALLRERGPSSVSTTVTRNSIVAQALQQFPLDIVEQTRSKIQDELRIQREALVQNIESGDALKRSQNQALLRERGS